MPEPTNHRAEAEYWLTHAVDAYENAQPVDVVHAKALIGIGHALLALGDTPPHGSSGAKCRGVYNDGFHSAPYRCGLPDGHQPPHLYEPPPIPRAPVPEQR